MNTETDFTFSERAVPGSILVVAFSCSVPGTYV